MIRKLLNFLGVLAHVERAKADNQETKTRAIIIFNKSKKKYIGKETLIGTVHMALPCTIFIYQKMEVSNVILIWSIYYQKAIQYMVNIYVHEKNGGKKLGSECRELQVNLRKILSGAPSVKEPDKCILI